MPSVPPPEDAPTDPGRVVPERFAPASGTRKLRGYAFLCFTVLLLALGYGIVAGEDVAVNAGYGETVIQLCELLVYAYAAFAGGNAAEHFARRRSA